MQVAPVVHVTGPTPPRQAQLPLWQEPYKLLVQAVLSAWAGVEQTPVLVLQVPAV
jgi:hypothetical protein